MAGTNEFSGNPSKAFIIGDREDGLFIVITSPVMVVHLTAQDLVDRNLNQMWEQPQMVTMAAVVQELLPLLRGADLVALRAREEQLRENDHGSFNLREEEGMLGELNYARTLAQVIRNNRTVCDVDFCIAVDIDPCEVAAMGRNTGPAAQICDYLERQCREPEPVDPRPQRFNITNLRHDNLDPLPPWQDPGPR